MITQPQHNKSQQYIMHMSWHVSYLTHSSKCEGETGVVYLLALQIISTVDFSWTWIGLPKIPVNVGDSFSRGCPHPLTIYVFQHSNPDILCHSFTCVKHKWCESPDQMGWALTHWGLDNMAAISQTTAPEGPIDNMSQMVRVMVWPHMGDKPSPEPTIT